MQATQQRKALGNLPDARHFLTGSLDLSLFARLVALRRITLYKNKRKDSMFKLTAKALACALSLSIAGMAQAADPIVIKFSHVVADTHP